MREVKEIELSIKRIERKHPKARIGVVLTKQHLLNLLGYFLNNPDKEDIFITGLSVDVNDKD